MTSSVTQLRPSLTLSPALPKQLCFPYLINLHKIRFKERNLSLEESENHYLVQGCGVWCTDQRPGQHPAASQAPPRTSRTETPGELLAARYALQRSVWPGKPSLTQAGVQPQSHSARPFPGGLKFSYLTLSPLTKEKLRGRGLGLPS